MISIRMRTVGLTERVRLGEHLEDVGSSLAGLWSPQHDPPPGEEQGSRGNWKGEQEGGGQAVRSRGGAPRRALQTRAWTLAFTLEPQLA